MITTIVVDITTKTTLPRLTPVLYRATPTSVATRTKEEEIISTTTAQEPITGISEVVFK